MGNGGECASLLAEGEVVESYVMRLIISKLMQLQKITKFSVLITVLGAKNLATLFNLLAPLEEDTKTYKKLEKVLK